MREIKVDDVTIIEHDRLWTKPMDVFTPAIRLIEANSEQFHFRFVR